MHLRYVRQDMQMEFWLGDLFERKQLERASKIEDDVKIYAPCPVHECMHTHIYTGFCVNGDEPADSITRELGSWWLIYE